VSPHKIKYSTQFVRSNKCLSGVLLRSPYRVLVDSWGLLANSWGVLADSWRLLADSWGLLADSLQTPDTPHRLLRTPQDSSGVCEDLWASVTSSPMSDNGDANLEVIACFPVGLDFGRGLVDINFTMWPLFKCLNIDNILTICEVGFPLGWSYAFLLISFM